MSSSGKSIAPRLAIRLVAVTSLVLALVGAMAFWSQHSQRHRQLAEITSASANQLSVALSLPLWNFQSEVVNRILDSAMELNDVAGIVVRQPNVAAPGGASVFARMRDAQWHPVPGLSTQPAGEITEQRRVVYEGKAIGSVELITTTRWINSRLYSGLVIFISLILLVDFILVACLYALLYREIITPLQLIERFASQVTEGSGEFADMPLQRFHGELDGLWLSVQTMVKLLQKRFAALRESEELFRTSFESATVGVCLVATNGRFLNVNRTLCSMLGYSKDELLELTFNDVTREEDKEIGSTFLRNALAGGPKTMQTEKRYLHKDGHNVWVFLSTAIIEPSHDHAGYIISHLQDITERKRAIEQLEMLKVSIDNNFDAAFWMDTNNQFVFVNDTACRVLGYAREELLGQPVNLVAPKATPQVLDEVWRQLRSTGFFNRESVHRRKDGSEFPVEIVASFVRFEGKEFNCGFARDISERKRLEQKQVELAAIVESSYDAIIGKSLAGIITSWNPGAEKIFGYSAAEAIGQPLLLIIPPEHQHEEAEILARIERGETVHHYETVRVRKDGCRIFISATISPLKDHVGSVIGASKIARDITSSRQVEEKLRETEANQRLLIDAVQEAFCLMKPDGSLTIVNQAFARRFGIQVDDLLGVKGYDLAPAPVSERRREFYEQLLKSGQPITFQDQRGGLDLENRIYPARNSAGEITHFAIFSQDITGRNRAELRLREQAELLDQASDAIFVTNFNNRITYWNRSAERLFGWTADQALGQRPEELFFAAPNAQVAEARQVLLELGQWSGEIIIRNRGGEKLNVDLRATLARDAAGELKSRLFVCTNITDHKRAEEQLISKTALLEAQVDSTIDGILVVDEQGRRILQNHRFLELFKVPDEIARDGDDQRMLRHAVNQVKDPVQFSQRVAYLYAHLDEIGRDEIELADGRVFDRYSSPVRDKAGRHYGRIWTFRDITEHRQLEAQFRQSQKMEAIGQLASGVAHDFNNILAVIQLQAGMLRISQCLPPTETGFLTEIEKSSERAANLTRQLLLFSRQQAVQLRNIDLNDVVVNITRMLQRVLGENIQLHFKYAPQPLFINADEGMMDQVLMNLVVNARDAMPGGGNLFIETSGFEFQKSELPSPHWRPGHFACLSVGDTGCGMSPEVQARIYEPFFTTKGIGKGTGLGLATVFGIVQKHQGWIEVKSEIGSGTTFRIYLPRLLEVADQATAEKSPSVLHQGQETILLVEDDQSLRVTIRKALSKLGYNLFEAATGFSALEVWKQKKNEIDLLLTDIMMPDGMSGLDLGERLLKESPKLKVIYMSGYAEAAGKDFTLEEDLNFLPKPFQAEKLARTIRNALDKTV